MKILTIIGNGFDLGHKLPTSFDNFIASNQDIYAKKYSILQGENNSWNNIENKYQQLLCKILSERSWLDVTEEIDRIISEYGLNEYGEVNYYNYEFEEWNSEINTITLLIDLLNEFEQDFHVYLKSSCGTSIILDKQPSRPIIKILNQSDTIINFNYTHTIELLYGISNVIHIHGDVDKSIAIGCGALEDVKQSLIDSKYPTMKNFTQDKHGFAEMMAYYEEDMEGNRVENHFIKRFFDEVAASGDRKETELFSLIDKKSKDSLILRQQIISMLCANHYDKVYIIGHSLGEADKSIFKAINKEATFTCFYHLSDDYYKKEATLNDMKFNYQLISDNDLYLVE